jgi:hypothetical protein
MEITQGNSLCSDLYLKLAKTSCFLFYLLCLFYEIREQEGRTGSAPGRSVGWYQWEGEGAGKRVGG